MKRTSGASRRSAKLSVPKLFMKSSRRTRVGIERHSPSPEVILLVSKSLILKSARINRLDLRRLGRPRFTTGSLRRCVLLEHIGLIRVEEIIVIFKIEGSLEDLRLKLIVILIMLYLMMSLSLTKLNQIMLSMKVKKMTILKETLKAKEMKRTNLIIIQVNYNLLLSSP